MLVEILGLMLDLSLETVQMHQDELLAPVELIACLHSLVVFIIDGGDEFLVCRCQVLHELRLAESLASQLGVFIQLKYRLVVHEFKL